MVNWERRCGSRGGLFGYLGGFCRVVEALSGSLRVALSGYAIYENLKAKLSRVFTGSGEDFCFQFTRTSREQIVHSRGWEETYGPEHWKLHHNC